MTGNTASVASNDKQPLLLTGFVVAVVADGVWISLNLSHRRLHRTLFNIAEPAISTWSAGHVFYMLARGGHLAQPFANTPSLLVAAGAMAAVFFFLNSGLTAIAIALENGSSP